MLEKGTGGRANTLLSRRRGTRDQGVQCLNKTQTGRGTAGTVRSQDGITWHFWVESVRDTVTGRHYLRTTRAAGPENICLKYLSVFSRFIFVSKPTISAVLQEAAAQSVWCGVEWSAEHFYRRCWWRPNMIQSPLKPQPAHTTGSQQVSCYHNIWRWWWCDGITLVSLIIFRWFHESLQ